MTYALLVIDVQNDYMPNGSYPLSNTGPVIEKINSLTKVFEEKGNMIIFIQHFKDEGFFIEGTWGAELVDGLYRPKKSQVLVKRYPNSFFQTDLQKILQAHKIENLIITGMMTHMCINSTTRQSAELGYQTTLISDATATRSLSFSGKKVSAEDVQLATLASLEVFATIETVEEYLTYRL